MNRLQDLLETIMDENDPLVDLLENNLKNNIFRKNEGIRELLEMIGADILEDGSDMFQTMFEYKGETYFASPGLGYIGLYKWFDDTDDGAGGKYFKVKCCTFAEGNDAFSALLHILVSEDIL